MSALRSSAGPAVWTNGTSSSVATICASEVLPRPGGPASSTWSSGSLRALAASSETASWSLTASWPTNSSSAAGRSERVLVLLGRGCGSWMRSAPGVRIIDARPFSAWAMRSSGVFPGAPSRSLSASCGLKPRPSSPSRASIRGSSPRMITIGSSLGRRADLLAQLDDDPLRRALADPGCGLQPRGVAGRDGAEHLARRAAGEDGERHLRPDGLDADQQQEQVALLFGGEAVEQQRVVADDQVGVERDVAPHPWHVPQRLRRHQRAGSRRRWR